MSSSNNNHNNSLSSSAGAAFVAFLRREADGAEQRAKQLRTQAQEMAHRFGIKTDDMVDLLENESHHNNGSMEMAPLDENGVPKYKGKKRGRKPKKRRRDVDPNRPKRQHTAYTYFVQENYPVWKELHATCQSKELITMVAKQWSHLSDLERDEWKARAKAQHHPPPPPPQASSSLVDNETNTTCVLPDDPDNDDDDDQYDDDLEDQEQDDDDDDGSTTRQTVPVGMESSTSKQGPTTTSTSFSPSRRAMKRPKSAPSKKSTSV